MSGNHFTGGELPHVPIKRLDTELYENVEKNVVYACTDVALRDPRTGYIFLGTRQTQPQLGPWFVGGRNEYGVGIDENAARQVKADLGLDIPAMRFDFIATYSTDFPIAAPGREDHGRHTVNSTLCLDMTPAEVEELNMRVANGEIRDEYSDGTWYDISDIADADSDFPFALKQFARDLYEHDLLQSAIREDAEHEHAAREHIAEEQLRDLEDSIRTNDLVKQYGLSTSDARKIVSDAGPNASYSVLWARSVAEGRDTSKLADQLQAIVTNNNIGDLHIIKELEQIGLRRPEVFSDNGPALRAILSAAVTTLAINESLNGELFNKLSPLSFIGRAGPGAENGI